MANKILITVIAVILVLGCSLSAVAAGEPAIDCRMDEGPCSRAAGPLVVTLAISPRPLKVMSELVFSVSLRERNAPVTDASVMVGLTMPGMVMGNNIVRLTHQGNGVYEGTGVIIRCPTGKKLWKASAMVVRRGSKLTADYIFEVTR